MFVPPGKFSFEHQPILSTPSVDVENYSRLREYPYPQKSINLPYYFLEEGTSRFPPIYMSDLNNLPLENFSRDHSGTIKRMYICLKEECFFKRYLIDEKNSRDVDPSSSSLYDREISCCNFRIGHIKADILQFTAYLKEYYNLSKNKFDSDSSAGFALAMGWTDINQLLYVTSLSFILNANVSLFIWIALFDVFVLRMQAYVHLTLSNYANGTGLTTWSFCPYLKGFGISMMMIQFINGVAFFYLSAYYMLKALINSYSGTYYDCVDPAFDSNSTLPICYVKKSEVTKNIECDVQFYDNYEIFMSDNAFKLIVSITNFSLWNFSFFNFSVYAITVIIWFLMTRMIKSGIKNVIMVLNFSITLSLMMTMIYFILTTFMLEKDVIKEATGKFFTFNNFFNINIWSLALRHTLRHGMFFYIEFGPKMPHKWHPSSVVTWRSIYKFLILFLTMWFAYISVYYEKKYYGSQNISCFVSRAYMINSAIPRTLNSLIPLNLLGSIFFLTQAFSLFAMNMTMIFFVWRNLNSCTKIFQRNNFLRYVFNAATLVCIVAVMASIYDFVVERYLVDSILFLEAIAFSAMVVLFDCGVFLYYGITRVWMDLEFLTRYKLSTKVDILYTVSIFISFIISLFGMAITVEHLFSLTLVRILLLTGVCVVPSIINIIYLTVQGLPADSVRSFTIWGERSREEQLLRHKFNRNSFFSALRLNKNEKTDFEEWFYMEQRRKSLIRLSRELEADELFDDN